MTTKEMFHLADDLIRDWMSYTNEPEEYDTQKSITDRLMDSLDKSNKFIKDELKTCENCGTDDAQDCREYIRNDDPDKDILVDH